MRLSDAEWKVMNAVWDDNPTSARAVLESMDTDWAYSTVKTILSRLTEKGALHEHKRANQSVYVPAVTKDDARQSAVESLLDRAFDGAFGSLFHYLVDDQKLSEKDRRALQAALKKKRRAT